MRINPVAKANELIPVENVLHTDYGLDVPVGTKNYRTWCPFGYEHYDEGRRKTMRVYSDTNSVHCFSHRQSWTSVDLRMHKEGLSRVDAAYSLLREYGIDYQPLTYDQVLDRRDRLNAERAPDNTKIIEPFRLWATTLPWYVKHRFDEEVAELESLVLSSLDEYEDVTEWLEKAKLVFRKFGERYNE